MIRLEKREDKSSPTRHEFSIFFGEKKTGRAFFHQDKGGNWHLTMHERQKISPNHYDDYPDISKKAIAALVGKAKEIGLPSFYFEKRKNDPPELHGFLRELGFDEEGGQLRIALKKPLLHRLAFWKK